MIARGLRLLLLLDQTLVVGHRQETLLLRLANVWLVLDSCREGERKGICRIRFSLLLKMCYQAHALYSCIKLIDSFKLISCESFLFGFLLEPHLIHPPVFAFCCDDPDEDDDVCCTTLFPAGLLPPRDSSLSLSPTVTHEMTFLRWCRLLEPLPPPPLDAAGATFTV